MAKKISEQEVRHICHLARLKPSEEEIHRFSEQLSDVLAYMEKLNELGTDDVQPTAHALPVHNVFRTDEPGDCLAPEQALNNAPQRDDNYFAVPKVLEQDNNV
jgi:aspartyl-tRNA(Asn)/glutamyl-tRNA(Gln) amidotransferase subunit C